MGFSVSNLISSPHLFNPNITDTLRQQAYFGVYRAVGTERSDFEIETNGEEMVLGALHAIGIE